MQNTTVLSKLTEGERGRVLSVDPALRPTTDRLGLIPGTEVLCLRRCPLGDPAVYWFRSTALALRAGDAEGITLALTPNTG
jgi:ferrous iron transport protein A